MKKEEAERWAATMCYDGTYLARTEYREKNQIGRMAEGVWNDPLFTYGIEYGILIAIKKIFGELD